MPSSHEFHVQHSEDVSAASKGRGDDSHLADDADDSQHDDEDLENPTEEVSRDMDGEDGGAHAEDGGADEESSSESVDGDAGAEEHSEE